MVNTPSVSQYENFSLVGDNAIELPGPTIGERFIVVLTSWLVVGSKKVMTDVDAVSSYSVESTKGLLFGVRHDHGSIGC